MKRQRVTMFSRVWFWNGACFTSGMVYGKAGEWHQREYLVLTPGAQYWVKRSDIKEII